MLYGVLLVVAGVLVVGFWAVRSIRSRRRDQVIARWAVSRGCSWEWDDTAFRGRFFGFPFDDGDNWEARNVVKGQWNGSALTVLDYVLQPSGRADDLAVRRAYTIVVRGLPISVPVLEVVREGVVSSLAKGLGLHDLEFENHAFNQAWKVSSYNRAFAYDVLSPRMMQWLMSSDGPPWRTHRDTIVSWRPGLVDPSVIESDIGYLDAIVAGIPPFVWVKLRDAT